MIIADFTLRNFKSYGNNTNSISLDKDKGELILIVGENGSGKSSILESIDFTTYGKVRGKKKKFQTNSSLPNRLNKNLETKLEFYAGKHKVNIERGVAPNKLNLFIDDIEYDRAGKSNIQDKINQLTGMDIETFKSFISLSVNDFKNFMSLTNEEKKILLDKLFNLELISILSKVLLEKKKQNKHQKDIFDSEIRAYESSLNTFNQSIERLKKISEDNTETQIEDYRQAINDKKEDFIKLQERLKIGKVKESEIVGYIQNNNTEINETTFKIKDYNERIIIFKSGKCPTCKSQLSSDTHQDYLNSMVDSVVELNKVLSELMSHKTDLDVKYNKLLQINSDSSNAFMQLKAYLENIKQNIKTLNESKNIDKEDDSINEMLNSISNIEKRKERAEDKLSSKDNEEFVLNEMKKILSEDGIKKSIISKIIGPINHFIAENITTLGMNFTIVLDDQFNAIITQLGEDLELDTLSTGETKKANISIMLAYLKLIRMKKHVNVLFLDEVFSSIDINGIYSILELLKVFSEDNNINIFLIHHAMLDPTYFDRILKIDKDITSNITEE